jgi:hypothetical protein
MFGFKKLSFCVDFKNLYMSLLQNLSKKGESQRTAASLFQAFFKVRLAISWHICRPSHYFTQDEFASLLRLSGML